MQKTLIIIPARHDSKRLSGKVLMNIGERSVLGEVVFQAKKSNEVDRCIVATDDQKVVDHCTELGIECFFSDTEHKNGTSRALEVASRLPSYDVVVNLQGDEPLIKSSLISEVIDLCKHSEFDIVSAVAPIRTTEALFDPGVVKTAVSDLNTALFFSRAVIPFIRDSKPENWVGEYPYLEHLGIYAFKKEVLDNLPVSGDHPLAESEKLEQLEWLAAGYSIGLVYSDMHSVSIDTIEDLEKVRAILKEK